MRYCDSMCENYDTSIGTTDFRERDYELSKKKKKQNTKNNARNFLSAGVTQYTRWRPVAWKYVFNVPKAELATLYWRNSIEQNFVYILCKRSYKSIKYIHVDC